MLLLAVAADAIGKLLRRAIVALGQSAPHSNGDVPPEFFKYPFC
jgi:hypothetical protein